jgi:hypothetical protein
MGDPDVAPLALLVRGPDRTGLLHALTGVISKHHGNIASVEIVERGERSASSFEIDPDREGLPVNIGRLGWVESVERTPACITSTASASSSLTAEGHWPFGWRWYWAARRPASGRRCDWSGRRTR